MIFYRYRYVDTSLYEFISAKLVCEEYYIYKETNCGYWITTIRLSELDGRKIKNNPNLHWISKKSKRRFAYPTKLEAIDSFLIRKAKYLNRLKYSVELYEELINLGNTEFLKLSKLTK